MTQINKELNNLYSIKWPQFSQAIYNVRENKNLKIKAADPLLLYIDDEDNFAKSDIRLMIYGQETNGWYGKENGTVDSTQALYDDFFNEGDCWSYSSHFWKGVKKFLSSLQLKFPDKKIRLIWNNIVKVGKHNDKGFPPDYIYKIEREFFNVISDELEILKPNVVIFLTGPNYDRIIKDNFGELNYEALPYATERQISRVSLKDVKFAYRTYHPNYLWRNDIDDYFDTIIEDINL